MKTKFERKEYPLTSAQKLHYYSISQLIHVVLLTKKFIYKIKWFGGNPPKLKLRLGFRLPPKSEITLSSISQHINIISLRKKFVCKIKWFGGNPPKLKG